MRVQREVAFRVGSAYCIVFEPECLMIAGVIPHHLLAREWQAIHRIKLEVDKRIDIAGEEGNYSFGDWQVGWDAEQRGRWTAEVNPYVRPWSVRKHGIWDTQLMSGHG